MWQLIIPGFIDWFKGKLAIKKARVEGELQVIKQASQNTADWEQLHAKGSQTSWKDEFWTIVFAIPLIMGFIGYAEEANEGFLALSNMPDWYQYTLVTMVLASFGIRIGSIIKGKMKL